VASDPRPSGSAPDLQALFDKLENYYDFECTGGPLKSCVEWQQLRAALAQQAAPDLRALDPITAPLVNLHCPFCWEDDFDDVGLKVHLSAGHCEAYNNVAALSGEPTKEP
jgi:hypothetical protein